MSRFPVAGPFPTRRAVLAACATGWMSALAGCSFFGSDQEEPTLTPRQGREVTPLERSPATGSATEKVPRELRDQYGTATNVVAAGADHTGRRPVGDVLRSEAGDDTVLYLPRGEYRIEEPVAVTGFSNLALVGDHALVRPPDGFTGFLFVFGGDSGATGLRFEGIDFDFTAPDTGGRPVHAVVEDGLLVRDVTVRGRQDIDHDSMRFDVRTASGSGHVERVRLPDGSATEYPNTGIYVGEQSRGELAFVDCAVAGFADNGLYASQAPGQVVVRGGHYANNGIASVRVSGGSTVDGVRVTCNTSRAGFDNMRGIRLRAGTDVSVTNCTVEMHSVTGGSDGAITMAEWLQDAVVEDTTVVLETDGIPAVNAKTPRRTAGADGIELKDVRVRGSAADGATMQVAERSGCLFENVCIHQDGPNRNGIELSDSRGNVLRNTVVDVTGEPLVLRNASAERTEFRTRLRADSCR